MLMLKIVKHTHTHTLLHLSPDAITTCQTNLRAHTPITHTSYPPPTGQLFSRCTASHGDTCPPINLPYLCRHMLWWEEVSQLESGHWHLTPVISTTAVWTHRWLPLLNVCICVCVCCLSGLVAGHALTAGRSDSVPGGAVTPTVTRVKGPVFLDLQG